MNPNDLSQGQPPGLDFRQQYPQQLLQAPKNMQHALQPPLQHPHLQNLHYMAPQGYMMPAPQMSHHPMNPMAHHHQPLPQMMTSPMKPEQQGMPQLQMTPMSQTPMMMNAGSPTTPDRSGVVVGGRGSAQQQPKKRKINKLACVYCSKLHKKCDGESPNSCSRCTTKGIECVYVQRAKRGPKTKRNKQIMLGNAPNQMSPPSSPKMQGNDMLDMKGLAQSPHALHPHHAAAHHHHHQRSQVSAASMAAQQQQQVQQQQNLNLNFFHMFVGPQGYNQQVGHPQDPSPIHQSPVGQGPSVQYQAFAFQNGHPSPVPQGGPQGSGVPQAPSPVQQGIGGPQGGPLQSSSASSHLDHAQQMHNQHNWNNFFQSNKVSNSGSPAPVPQYAMSSALNDHHASVVHSQGGPHTPQQMGVVGASPSPQQQQQQQHLSMGHHGAAVSGHHSAHMHHHAHHQHLVGLGGDPNGVVGMVGSGPNNSHVLGGPNQQQMGGNSSSTPDMHHMDPSMSGVHLGNPYAHHSQVYAQTPNEPLSYALPDDDNPTH